MAKFGQRMTCKNEKGLENAQKQPAVPFQFIFQPVKILSTEDKRKALALWIVVYPGDK